MIILFIVILVVALFFVGRGIASDIAGQRAPERPPNSRDSVDETRDNTTWSLFREERTIPYLAPSTNENCVACNASIEIGGRYCDTCLIND